MGIDSLMERSGDLKQDLLAFATGPRFARFLKPELQRRFGHPATGEDGELENFFDWFIMQYRRPDGRTLIDCYLPTRPELPAEQQEFLRGWHDVVEGLFQVTGRDGDVLVTDNLIDDLEYRMRTNVDPAIFDQLPVGSYLATRVVPLGDQWLLSGTTATFGERTDMLPMAADMASRHPELVFRNPERLARGWELQRADRAAFVEYFGSDTVVIERSELARRLHEFAARRYPGSPVGEDWAESIVTALHPSAASAGLIYDEYDGLGVYADYALALEAFDAPELVAQRRCRTLLKTYLTDESVSPIPFERLARRDEAGADAVFRKLLGKPGFRWSIDGEALLRRHKPDWYARPQLPRTVVFGERLAAYFRDRPGG